MTPTTRQLEVLQAQFRYGTQKDAAAALGIRVGTVKDHLTKLFRRLGVENTAEAAYRLWLRDLWGESK